jgi:uncharacterized membrane protein
MINPKDFFSIEEKLLIESAIAEAELNTSGEIRVHLDKKCNKDVLDCATDAFTLLKMHKTKERNGVMFYLAINQRKFAILGDVGINNKVPADFWDNVRDLVLSHFKQNNFALGLKEGILLAGQKLKEHFPYKTDDKNELSNSISM